jgi:AGZA family xanthine/uracil permease-like MFS transporter
MGDEVLDSWLTRRFALASRGTSIRTEIVAGATTFLTMAYIILVNPAILGQAGVPIAGAAAATCLAAGFGSILMGFVADVPLALAPGMGLNAYFSFTVVQGMGVPWPVALGCVFVSGIAFLLLTLAGVRQAIVRALPPHLLAAIAGGIGLFIGLIGLKDAGLVTASPATMVTLGNLRAAGPLLALFGLLLIAVLAARRVRGAILIGIAVTTLVATVAGQVHLPSAPYDIGAIRQTAFHLDLAGVFGFGGKAGLGVLEILFVFLFVDLFDNVGTLVAVTRRAGLVGSDGRIPRLNRMLITDSIATMVGALAGTSTTTSYIESAAGVEAGGRTGLTAIVTGMLFLAVLPFAPYAQLVPLAATAPALILVGGLMLAPLAEIHWNQAAEAVPAFLTVAMIPFTFSIANGLAFGLTAHAAIRIATGKAGKSDIGLLILASLFVLRFAWITGA